MRLRQDMTSLRLMALRFVRAYIARWGASLLGARRVINEIRRGR